jgi:hypothetical protein
MIIPFASSLIPTILRDTSSDGGAGTSAMRIRTYGRAALDMIERIACVLAIALSVAPVQAKRWSPTVAGTAPATVTCEQVRWAVRLVGVDVARENARALGMTWAQERRAAHCLKSY